MGIEALDVLLGALAIAAPAVLSLMVGIPAMRLRRLRFREPTLREIGREAVPARDAQVLGGASELLAGFGFSYRRSVEIEPMIEGAGQYPVHLDVYLHRDGDTHAVVTLAAMPEQGNAFTIFFESRLDDGRTLSTMDCYRHLVLAVPPGREYHDDYLADVAGMWDAHQARVRAAGSPVSHDHAAYDAASAAAPREMVANLARQGRLVPTDGAWRLTWRYALAYAWQLLRGQRRADAARKRQPAPQSAAPAHGSDGELHANLHAFEQQLAAQRAMKASATQKWKRFIITGLLFLGVGALWMDWVFAVMLLAVIALHEGGHYVAMRWSGFRNLSVFFLPGLGGLAIGEKAEASPWEKLLVYLAGPIPGLLLAGAGLGAMLVAAWQPPSWFLHFLIVSLIVNYLNLLPIAPLDGGRVLEIFLFARWPVARFVFAALGFAALLLYGIAASDTVMLVIAVFVGLTLPHQWRVMRVDRAVDRGSDGVLDERGAIERVFTALQRSAFVRWPFALRSATAMSLLPELQGRRPRPAETAAGLSIYLACLVVPPLLLVQAFPRSAEFARHFWSTQVLGHKLPPPWKRDWYADADRADSLPEPERLEVLLGAAERAWEEDDTDRASRYLDRAWVLATQRAPRDPQRTRTLLARTRAAEGPARTELFAQLIAELEGASDRDSVLALAQTREMQAWDAEGADRIALLRQAVAHREQFPDGQRYALRSTRHILAQHLDEAGDAAAAEILLRRNVDAFALPAAGDPKRAAHARAERLRALDDLAWFLIAHQRHAEAVALLADALSQATLDSAMSRGHPLLLARETQVWALREQGEEPELRAAWKRYLEEVEAVGQRSPPTVLQKLDAFVLAQAAGDATAAARYREQILKAAASGNASTVFQRTCQPLDPNGHSAWREVQWRSRGQAARALGLCQGS